MESMPWNMVKLPGPPLKKWPAGDRCQCNEYAFSAHYPEHIKSAEGIE
jgi:hypothetical protein